MAIDKNTIMKEAQKYTTKGQYDKAIAEWKKLLKETPNDANLYNTIGDLSLKKNAKVEAVDAYKKAADILASDGFTSKAIALYKKSINIDPTKIEVHLALGDLNAEKGLTGNALESYKIVADHYTQQKNTAKALGIYQKMADLNPANIAFRIKLGDMYAKEGMKAEAAKAYLDAADIHISRDAFKDARQLFEKVLSCDPENKAVYHKAGIVYLREGKFGEAYKALKPAFENDPANRELAGVYLEALSKAGKDHDAEQVVGKILAADPDRNDLREKLCQIYLAKKEYDKALDVSAVLAQAYMEKGDHEGAEGTLKKFIAATPHYSPGRQRLAEFYVTAGRQEDAANTLVQTAEILIDDGDQAGAEAALRRSLEIDPGRSEATELLNRLAELLKMPPEPPDPQKQEAPDSAFAPPQLEPLVQEPEEQIPAAEVIALPEGELHPREQGAEAPVAEESAVAPLAEPVPAPEMQGPAIVEDAAIVEAFTEIDVLVKYGLATKAADQLEALARKYPDSLAVRIKLRDVYGDLGQMNKAATHMVALANLYDGRGMLIESQKVLREALQLDPTNATVRSKLGVVQPIEPEAPAWLEPRGIEAHTLESPTPEPAETTSGIEAPPAFGQIFSAPEPAPSDEIVFEGLDSGMSPLEEATPVEEAPVAGAAFPFVDEAAAPIQEPAPIEDQPPQPEQIEEEAAESITEIMTPEPAALADISEIWAEAEFYYQQGLFDEAKKHYAKILELHPDEKQAIARLAEISKEEEETKEFTQLAEAVEGLEGALTAESSESELPMSASDEEAVRSLMSEIAQLKKPAMKPAPAPPVTETIPASKPPQKKSPALPAKPAQPTREEVKLPSQSKTAPERRLAPPELGQETAAVSLGRSKNDAEDFFDLGEELQKEIRNGAGPLQKRKTDDYFDLASELRDELSNITVPARPASETEEQSLDEIFEEFKKGVEQQSVKEDVDTHYNLGVAYKEMGLLDDAIAEFILTPEEEPKYIHSRNMLGLCYMEKGEFESAIAELDNALSYSDKRGETERNRIGMHYDLGLAYQGAGDISSALSEFQKVQRIDPNYRDTAAKLTELKQGDFISLDHLKDDIEKEISAKFLEEGERIEREEKNRKNEKVRN